MLGGQDRVAPSASGQLVALVEQFVDLTTRRRATMLTDRAAHSGQQPQFEVDSVKVAHKPSARPRVDVAQFIDGEHFHVSMLHVPFGPWQRARANSQPDV
jgi:hypothetical protein